MLGILDFVDDGASREELLEHISSVLPNYKANSLQIDLLAWIIPKDALSSCFSTQGIT